jgi:hypothetical protein
MAIRSRNDDDRRFLVHFFFAPPKHRAYRRAREAAEQARAARRGKTLPVNVQASMRHLYGKGKATPERRENVARQIVET